MEETKETRQKIVIFAADCGDYDMVRSIEELIALCESAEYDVVCEVIQKKEHPEKGTFLGIGKLAEGRLICSNLDADMAIFDAELSGIQIRNIEQRLEVPVIDRTMLILDIFSQRATTNEGKLQVELAKLKYRLPRLIGLGNSLSRQGGGGGGGGGARRGAGESKLEYDRRYIHTRIEALEEKLLEIEKHRSQTRKNRQKNGVPVIALVGYTNVGKSSLLNKICDCEIFAKDMLFATLDPTARKYTMPSGQNVIFVDTVGFVSRLPHNLVKAFKSTLEEATFADIILKICDLSDPEALTQLQVTDEVLGELDCEDSPQIVVYNQCDKLENVTFFDANALHISAKTGLGIDNLLAEIDTLLQNRVQKIAVMLGYDKLAVSAFLRQNGTILKEEYREKGVYVEGIVKKSDMHQFTEYLTEFDEE